MNGYNKDRSNIMNMNDRGQTYTLRRLDRDHPELFGRVKAGELSANAAAIEAGFRVKTVTLPLDPERAAKTLRKHLGEDDCRELAALLELPW